MLVVFLLFEMDYEGAMAFENGDIANNRTISVLFAGYTGS
jgi:hypothetical protein